VVSGGFPCQVISVAGNGLGVAGACSGLRRQMALDGGHLTPEWAEWLMGWPIGGNDLEHWQRTGSSRGSERIQQCLSVKNDQEA